MLENRFGRRLADLGTAFRAELGAFRLCTAVRAKAGHRYGALDLGATLRAELGALHLRATLGTAVNHWLHHRAATFRAELGTGGSECAVLGAVGHVGTRALRRLSCASDRIPNAESICYALQHARGLLGLRLRNFRAPWAVLIAEAGLRIKVRQADDQAAGRALAEIHLHFLPCGFQLLWREVVCVPRILYSSVGNAAHNRDIAQKATHGLSANILGDGSCDLGLATELAIALIAVKDSVRSRSVVSYFVARHPRRYGHILLLLACVLALSRRYMHHDMLLFNHNSLNWSKAHT